MLSLFGQQHLADGSLTLVLPYRVTETVFCMLSETNAVLPILFPLESVNTMEKKQHMLGLPGATFLFITWFVQHETSLELKSCLHTPGWKGELGLRLKKHLPREGWLTVKASVSGVGPSPVKEMKAAS